MAGNAPLALHRLDAVAEGLTLRKPLHGMPSVKMDHVHGTPGKVQLRGHYPAQGDGSFPSVYHFHRPGDDVAVPGNGFRQLGAGGGDAADVGHRPLLLHFILDVDGIAFALINGGNQVLRHIGEDNMVAALLQQSPDKAPADIARANHNCLFHVIFCSF